MIRIGFIDNYLDEWHANNYPRLFAEAASKTGIACEIVGAFALRDAPNGKRTTEEWCCAQGIRKYDSPEALAEDCDALLVFAPDDPELPPSLLRACFRLGSPPLLIRPLPSQQRMRGECWRLQSALAYACTLPPPCAMPRRYRRQGESATSR